ncbi:MAG: Segregation and condensation protein A [Candidatus Uhrbacteria bacterium GW2011_GWD2_52_7]|uniref:Segregation and condensation protein A n=1 Tax=Candidatus Uhrbacteria bacterium GW2011_GWD2_52_7 TaxID=1618989 RepID=A0A0G1ZMY2_9BACT|nr:MAG: Segregation and condensation protein A [Candidatus Uhrbacteria bacterium GW2011_GWD2_52_7]
MAFAVSQEKFSGPLELLLALIEEKKLTITEVSLKSVADEYLAYLETHEVPSDELADFLLVASRLIYLKSRELMPYLRLDDEDANAAKLEDQLRLYREFVAAAAKLEERYLQAPLYRRPFVRPQREMQFAPGKALMPAALADAYRSVLKRLEPFFALQQTSIERVKSIEERIEELTGALKAKATMRFKDVIASAGSKVEVVVSFLALLELLRRRSVRVKQDDHYGEIMIERYE